MHVQTAVAAGTEVSVILAYFGVSRQTRDGRGARPAVESPMTAAAASDPISHRRRAWLLKWRQHENEQDARLASLEDQVEGLQVFKAEALPLLDFLARILEGLEEDDEVS